ncbi:hypothetical protein ACFZAG_38160 [Streptomyces sp. NPDC012403]|uniref:hypothetical protein n=1 Tax=Streptomyces sp. NPDC012403 TaxID=3364831 RepID=UPI0036E2150C
MQRVYRHALREGLISSDVYRVLSGTVGAQGMRDLLGVPAHRLWATAVHQQVLPAGPGAYAMNRLVKQEFGMARADRQRISERLAPMALSAYRSQEDDRAGAAGLLRRRHDHRPGVEAAVDSDQGQQRLGGPRRRP